MRPTHRTLVKAVVAAALSAGCGYVRPSDFPPACPQYAATIQPIFDAQCAACHGNGGAAGYELTDYRHALRPSDADVARVIAGDPASLLLQAARGEHGAHVAIAASDVEQLTLWIVDCKAAPGPTQFHPTGWASPIAGESFHGSVLRDAGYDFQTCQSCHGDDLRGGKAQVDCNSCHVQGPSACNTCHGDETSAAPPRSLSGSWARSTVGVGAHRQHVVDGPLHRAFACESCHPPVTLGQTEGHYRFDGGFTASAPVVVLAATDGGAPATWTPSSASCSQSACHAPNPADSAALATAPVWTSVSGAAAQCGTCHGLGPTGHLSNRCEGCHGAQYKDGGVDLALHVNGRVDFEGNDCGACHAAPGTVAFYDTHFDRDAGSPTVGAHEAHLAGGELRGALGCEDCHKVPARPTDPGHVDASPAEVFGAGWPGGLASAGGATPSYSAGAGTCSNSYCHGNGALLATDATPGLLRTPVWTLGDSQIGCGTACHGTPPQDGSLGHSIVTSVQDCVLCHAASVNPDGTIRLAAQPDGGWSSTHLNGVLNGN